jgi:PIN domain nuclease of toxin-antitoxin system
MIILDTHVLVWWISNPEKLSPKVRQLIEKEMSKGVIHISSISVWEIYLLVKKERLQFAMDTDEWLKQIESLPFVAFIPVDNTIAAMSVMLPGEFPNDPADRIIVATAREKGTPLVTMDERIRKYPHIKTIW